MSGESMDAENVIVAAKDKRVLLKVKKCSNPHKVADAIAKHYMEDHDVEIQAIAAGAINQAVKSVAIARGKLAQQGRDIAIIPGFRDVTDSTIEGKTISAINFSVIERGSR